MPGDENFPGATYSPFNDIASSSKLQPLLDAEIEEFFDELDKDKDGNITLEELQSKLIQVYQEMTPAPQKQPDRRSTILSSENSVPDLELGGASINTERDGLKAFLSALLPDAEFPLSKEEFTSRVNAWNVPSQKKVSAEASDEEDTSYEARMTWWRKGRAWWSVEGPKLAFLAFFFVLILAWFLWQGFRFVYDVKAVAAFGPGVVAAKFFAGSLYPVLFFMIMSMSRWLSTAMRHYYWISRFVDWDKSKDFHILVNYIGLAAASCHGIGHSAGTFLHGSKPEYQTAVAAVVGHDVNTYAAYWRLIPGWSGGVALGIWWVITILSQQYVRKKSYELFQLGHLLMFPFMAMCCVHGTSKLLEYPMLGFWLAVPIFFVLTERSYRVVRGFIRLNARVKILDNDTVTICIKHRRGQNWRYFPGQYVFLQVPQLSMWQWHPFTISACIKDELHLHIKTDGNWTSRLRDLPTHEDIHVGIDGPFGAPAQRFYDFDRAIIIGAGVGITPFSCIINDLEQHLRDRKDPWVQSKRDRSKAVSRKGSAMTLADRDGSETLPSIPAGFKSPSMKSPSSRSLRWDVFSAGRNSSSQLTLAAGGSPLGSPNPDQMPMTPKTPRRQGLLRKAPKQLKHGIADDLVPARRRVDLHWTVRDRDHLMWFASLLNRAHDLAVTAPRDDIELNIATHITAPRKNISTHVFRYLLDAYRTESAPYSALTGLKTRSQFGRPDFDSILTDFYKNETQRIKNEGTFGSGERIGVFFCGNTKVGRVLADKCEELTHRARADGSLVRFIFMTEVFG